MPSIQPTHVVNRAVEVPITTVFFNSGNSAGMHETKKTFKNHHSKKLSAGQIIPKPDLGKTICREGFPFVYLQRNIAISWEMVAILI